MDEKCSTVGTDKSQSTQNETSHHLLVVEVSRAKVVEAKLIGVQVEEQQVRPGGSRTAVNRL